MSRLVSRLNHFPETIFATMTNLAVEKGAVNLGQGFPDEDGPRSMLEEAVRQIRGGNNQYPPGRGFAGLRAAVAADRRRSHGHSLDPDTEVLVTVGATEAISATVLALVEPGSEVVVIEPYYDAYAAAVALAGATLVPVPLLLDACSDSGWRLDHAALRAAVGADTSMIIINTPHNPTGHVFCSDDLEAVADLARRHDLLVLSDEVYEKLVYDGRAHTPIALLPGMRERTVTVSSAAKCLNVTGWKTGWAMSTPEIIDAVTKAKQFLTFVGVGHVQPAVAHALDNEQAWMERLRDDMQRRRNLLMDGLDQAGFDVKACAGGYFVIADATPLGVTDAAEFCTGALIDRGVVGIPVSAFATSGNTGHLDPLVRFAFCKRENLIRDAVARLV
ncbi:pyridoxal phosphate-dependent aminotransferase [Corynebacterium sp. CCM 9185]|uniref:Pyridoxal phosphate-dependent aminotransferase n=1 Tax=Corynebacterium marambiense TaxID=2765364 RepID=A0ABS0VUB4_9CORY|nr:pyridoxal phosphate-dependent aminotransferase [Corynebacterium marambiense]MBI9000354.1 pyridoxal phosphate-dependent aminotransferase [Corynebacterium marambiense]MCK7663707.1 pyridoxal phosphate-dependent aminotransferase [Corynebacterium marambiense]MCX7541858.1 pyridoxal phosphate-dependent aminotransferase [Corynebacterium marambiense]